MSFRSPTLPPTRPHPAGRRRTRGVLACAAALALLALPALSPPAPAQGVSIAPQENPADDPAQDILIEGLGFSKLIVEVHGGERGDQPGRQQVALLLEKNLCWSGLFNLWQGGTRYCALRTTPQRIDMRLELAWSPGRVRVRLKDAGPEELLLFEDFLPVRAFLPEPEVMALVNRLTRRITGQPGLLGSTLAFVLRQPGYAKVIVRVNTHGEDLERISANQDINLLPRWGPGGQAIVYTVLSALGSRVYYHDLGNHGGGGASRYLTDNPGLNTGGAFSPDGRRVVLTMSVGRSADLYEVNLDSNAYRRLTTRQGIETQADWSPDGKQVVFVSDRTGTPQVYLYDFDTGEDLRLTFDGAYNADPKWSPDGKSILFTKRVGGRDQIHIMDRYGENVRPVTRGRYDAEQAAWSPDGHQIAFTSNRTGTFKIYVVSTDGSNLRRLTGTGRGFEETSPTWTFHGALR